MFGPVKWFPAQAVANSKRFWRRAVLVGALICVLPFTAQVGMRLYSWYLSLYRINDLASEEALRESFRLVVHGFDSQDKAIVFPARKWTGSVPVYFDASLPEWHRTTIQSYFPVLENLTGLRFLETPVFDKVWHLNVFYAASAKEVTKLAHQRDLGPRFISEYGEANCYVIVDPEQVNHRIGRLVVFKRDQEHPLAVSCVLEEMLQALGLHADRATYSPSLFSTFTNPLEIPLNDRILLRTLYDPTINSGMREIETAALVPQIIHRLVVGVKTRGEEALYQHQQE
mgnify:FL=1|tara:strand:+ start:604 stop:1458 length:855 start_codon:yes stop_codon:yes gene_type:complete